MSKARASIECIAKFRKSVDELSTAVKDMASSANEVDAILNDAEQKKAKIEESQACVNDAIGRGNEKKEKLNNDLSVLYAEKANTPPTVPELVKCGKDAEGNDIYKEVEKPNPIYIALSNQISFVKGQIAAVDAVIGQLRTHSNALAKAKQGIETAMLNLKNQRESLTSECASIAAKSSSASAQLGRAITAVQNYLGITAHINPVPSHTTIAWTSYNYTPTSTSGAHLGGGRANRRSQLTKTEMSSIQQRIGAQMTVLSGSRGSAGANSAGGNSGAVTGGAKPASGGKRWTQTVFEQDVSFKYNGEKRTVQMKRKIHQINDPIDYDYVRPDGMTNRQAMMKGKSPLVIVRSKDGKEVLCPLDLHHLTQQENIKFPNSEFTQGTMVEMPSVMHKKYNKQIHMQYKHENGVRRSFRVEKKKNHKWETSEAAKQFEAFKKDYWRWRIAQHDAENS